MSSLRYAFRQFGRKPGLSVVIVLMLALGVGATTGMYSIYHTVLVQPLPVPEPERLVNLISLGPKWGMDSTDRAGPAEYVFSYPMFRDLEERQQSLTGIAGHRSFDANLSFDGRTLAAIGMLVSGSYFDVLNVQPALGRLLGPQDEPRVDESPVVVLSYEYWRDYLGADRDVINRTMTINGQVLTIVGVAPKGFNGTTLSARPAIFVPLTLRWLMMPTRPRDSEDRRSYWVYLFARLRDGVEVSSATAELNGLHSAILADVEQPLNADMPDDVMERFLARQITLEPGARGQSNVARYGGQPVTVLLGVGVLVLVIVCVNVASLLLARSESRLGETAIRASIGATRGRLIRQFLTESAVLAVCGGLAAIPVANATIRAVVAMLPVDEAGTIGFGLQRPAFIVAAFLSMATIAVFGLVPALRASRVRPAALVNAHGDKSTESRFVLRLRNSLATTQIALSMMLLGLAGLFLQSFYNVTNVNIGMDVDSLITFSVSPGLNGYEQDRVAAIFDRIEAGLAGSPGVTDVALSTVTLLTGENWGGNVFFEGRENSLSENRNARFTAVSPEFLSTFSIPLLNGRNISESDRADAPRIALVNETFTRRFAAGGSMLGQRIGLMGPDSAGDLEIVGIVGDTKYSEVKDVTPPQVFLPWAQLPFDLESMTFYLRSSTSADVAMQNALAVVSRVDPTLPVTGLMTMHDVVRGNVFLDRVVGTLSAGLAMLATVLAAIGLYSVLAYNVTRRTREIGLRLALGATPFLLRASVLKETAVMTLIGGCVGLIGAVALGRLARSLMFEMSGSDPLALAGAAIVVAGVVFAAGFLPARRASRVAPMEALRYE